MSFMVVGGGDAGIADGRDGILQRKTTKRSLGNESSATPVRIMGRKEGHRNSEPDQPGKAQVLGKTMGNEVQVCVSLPWIVS